MKHHAPNLLECALSAQDAYADDVVCAYCWTLEVDGLRVVYHYDEIHQRLWVAFRGTANAENWLTNIRFWGRTHKGIQDAAYKLMPDVVEVARQIPWRDVCIVGHSLGGALAEHSAEYFLNEFPDAHLWVCTFGAVRSRKMWEAMQYQAGLGRVTIRCVNNGDVVPQLLWWKFRHVGKRVYFDRHGEMVKTRIGWLALQWDRLAGTKIDGKPDWVDDHAMGEYVRLARKHSRPLDKI